MKNNYKFIELEQGDMKELSADFIFNKFGIEI
jgi:hypothetical protein